jgi:hypothetical protein
MPDRFVNISDGTAMVVSDLHGDRDAFDRCIAHFRAHYARGKAQRLILLGDLIHSYGPPDQDASLDMVLDVMALRDEFGPDTVLMLLGNHEMPHLYGVMLSKGELDFTPRFEHMLGPHRETVLAFFDSLPFYVRTAAGVMLSHAGPSPDSIQHARTLRHFDHRALLRDADHVLAQADDLMPYYRQFQEAYGVPYDAMARKLLAVEGPHDPRYSHLLRASMFTHQSREFDILWQALFTQNEAGLIPSVYDDVCEEFLSAFSEDAPVEQRVMVSGHIPTPGGGHTLVSDWHLRIASAAHARPRSAGRYLLFDCAAPIETARDLLDSLRTLFN